MRVRRFKFFSASLRARRPVPSEVEGRRAWQSHLKRLLRFARNDGMVFCLILFSIIAFSGCATLKKGRLPKLIRGQKTKDIEETEETAKGMISCHRIYRNAYILWQACQEELIKKLGSNKKKDILLRERVIQNLERMQSCLLREKRDLFKGQIERFKELTEDLNTRRLNISQSRRLKRELYNQKRQIQREFSYKKMGGWIKPDK